MATGMDMVNTASSNSKRLLLLACLIPHAALAGDWEFKPTLSLQERFSDNIALSSTDKESSFLTEVTPGFKLSSKGGKGSFSVDYGLQGLLYSHDRDANSLNNQLNASLKSELFDDSFQVDGTARIAQQSASLVNGAVGSGNYNTDKNRTETRSASLTPSWRGKIGSTAKWDATWQLTFADSDGAISGTSGSNLNLGLSSGNAFNRIPWSVAYRIQNTDGSASSSSRSNSLSGTVGYIVSPKTRFNLTVGKDDNNGNTSSFDEVGGTFWNLGVNWNPTPRTSLAATAGHRHGGSSYGLNFSHRTRKSNWGLRYSESVDDTFNQINSTGAFDIYQCGGSQVIVPAGSGSPDPALCGTDPVLPAQLLDATEIVDDTTFNKTWNATVSYTLGKSTFSGNFNQSRRTQLTSGDKDRNYSLGGSWSLKLNSRMTSTLSLNTASSESDTSESDDWTVAWILSRTLAKNATGAMEVRRLERKDDATTGGYTENSVSARLNMSF